jgi:hypothetical protein
LGARIGGCNLIADAAPLPIRPIGPCQIRITHAVVSEPPRRLHALLECVKAAIVSEIPAHEGAPRGDPTRLGLGSVRCRQRCCGHQHAYRQSHPVAATTAFDRHPQGAHAKAWAAIYRRPASGSSRPDFRQELRRLALQPVALRRQLPSR